MAGLRSLLESPEYRARKQPQHQHDPSERRRCPYRRRDAVQRLHRDTRDALRRGRKRRRVEPSVILVFTNPGRTTSIRTPSLPELVSEPLREGVKARLRCAVDGVCAPRALGGDRGEHDDCSAAVATGDRPSEAASSPRRRCSPAAARPPPGCRTEALRAPRAPRPPGSRCPLLRAGQTRQRSPPRLGGVQGIEVPVYTGEHPAARSSSAARSSPAASRPASITCRGRRLCSSRTIASAISDVPPRTRTRRPARVVPAPLMRLPAQPETGPEVRAHYTIGVYAGLLGPEVLQFWVHRPQMVAVKPDVLAQVDPPACLRDHVVQPVQAGRSPGCGAGNVDRERPSLDRKGQRPPKARAESLEHREADRQLAEHLEAPTQSAHLSRRKRELVLDEPVPAVAVSSAGAVQREEVGITSSGRRARSAGWHAIWQR